MIKIPNPTNPNNFLDDMIAQDALTLKKFKTPQTLIAAAHIFLYIKEFPTLETSKDFGCTPELVIQFFQYKEPFICGYIQFYNFLCKYTFKQKGQANQLIRKYHQKALKLKIFKNRLDYLNLEILFTNGKDFELETYELLLSTLKKDDYKKDDPSLFHFIVEYLKIDRKKALHYLEKFVLNSNSILTNEDTFNHFKALRKLEEEEILELPDKPRELLLEFYKQNKDQITPLEAFESMLA